MAVIPLVILLARTVATAIPITKNSILTTIAVFLNEVNPDNISSLYPVTAKAT